MVSPPAFLASKQHRREERLKGVSGRCWRRCRSSGLQVANLRQKLTKESRESPRDR